MTRRPTFTRWLVRLDENEAVFQRPFAERLLCGLLALGFAYLLGGFVVFAYYQGASGQNMLPLGFVMFLVLVPLFAFGAGPKEIRFDFQRRLYQSKEGFPMLTWTRTGSFDEIIRISVWNTKFTGLGVKWKQAKRGEFTFFGCTNVSEAWEVAKQIEDRSGLPAQKGVPRGVNNP